VFEEYLPVETHYLFVTFFIDVNSEVVNLWYGNYIYIFGGGCNTFRLLNLRIYLYSVLVNIDCLGCLNSVIDYLFSGQKIQKRLFDIPKIKVNFK
jgi:hypothetical protein